MRTGLVLACVILLTTTVIVQPETAASLITRGDRERLEGRYAAALETYERSRQMAEQAGDLPGVARGWNALGTAYSAQSEYARALTHLEQGLALRRQIDDRAGMAQSYSNIGIVYRLQGRFAQAITSYEQALALLEPSDRLQRARTLNNLGVAYSAQGDYDRALQYYRESLPLNEALENAAGIGSTLVNIGIISRQQGDNATALRSYERALTVSREIGDRRLTAEALKAIGVIHSTQENTPLAMDFFEQALAIYIEIGNQAETALVRNNIGGILARTDRPAAARTSYLEALRIREAIGDRVGLAESRQSLGSLARRLGDLATAEREYTAALTAYESLGDRRGTVTALIGLHQIANMQARHADALAFGRRSLGLTREMRDRDRLWQTLTLTGRTHVALGDTAAARQAFTEAVTTIEALRSDVAGGDADRQRSFERKIAPYQNLMSLAIAEGATADALQLAERAKARVVLDILQSGRVNVTTAMTDAEQAEERAVHRDLASLNAQVLVERRRTPADPAALADLERQLARAQLAREALETRLFSAHPELRVRRSESAPAGFDRMAAMLPDDGTAALEYVVTSEAAWLFVLTRSTEAGVVTPNLRVHRLALTPDQLESLVDQLGSQLARRDLRFRSTAARAYDALLGPASAQLTRATALVIVPDGVLWRVPFQALWRTKPGQYVVETQAVQYAPSLSVLAEIRRAKQEAPGGGRTSGTLLAFGDPATGSRGTSAGGDRRADSTAPLPTAAAEVRTLRTLYGGSVSKVYVGADAREDRLKAEAGQFGILHLATHGILNDVSPMYSHVLLAPSPDRGGDDGLLQAWEIARLQLAARLVVLSGCETAGGRVAPGEGVIGLTWALFVAGASTAIVSQWSVDSASTSTLMLGLHRQMLGGGPSTGSGQRAQLSPARALQRAAIPLIHSAQYRHPFYWAGFVVMGDGF